MVACQGVLLLLLRMSWKYSRLMLLKHIILYKDDAFVSIQTMVLRASLRYIPQYLLSSIFLTYCIRNMNQYIKHVRPIHQTTIDKEIGDVVDQVLTKKNKTVDSNLIVLIQKDSRDYKIRICITMSMLVTLPRYCKSTLFISCIPPLLKKNMTHYGVRSQSEAHCVT